jgi:hypothetical protein
MSAETIFDKAISEIQSESIRKWAVSQKHIWMKFIAENINKEPIWFTTYMVATAIGLID